MERAKYFNYTKPSQTQLNYTEDSRSRAILRRQRSSAQMGVRTGFRITVNPLDATKIDIGTGEGYTGGYFTNKNLRSTYAGELVTTISTSASGSPSNYTKQAQALADYTSGALNYISLVYVETESHKLAENRTPFTEHDTIVAESYTVEALEETDWLLLSDDDLENRILVGIVTARGSGVALTTADIDQVIQPNNHPYAVALTTMTAIIIMQVSDETTIGTGTIRWDPTTSMVYWSAPGDSEGVGTSVTSNGTYYIYSATTSFFLKTAITFAALPGAETSETVTISALYGRAIPMYSAVDQAHRDMVGTGTKSTANPHGLAIEDISGGPFEHADLFHVCGITSHADRGQLQPTVDDPNNRIAIANLGSKDNSFLIDGSLYETITGVPVLTNGYVNFNVGMVDGEYLIYLNSAGVPSWALMSDVLFVDPVPTYFNGNVQLVDMSSTVDGACQLDWDQNAVTFTFTGVDGGAGTPIPVDQNTPAYYKLYSGDPLNWIIIYVANDPGATGTLPFNTAFNAVDAPNQSILKLASVYWYTTTETLGNIHDLRRFNTADNRTALEEEHDEWGQHSKVIHNPFRVAGLNDTAVFASAATFGLRAEGGNPTVAQAGTGGLGIGYGLVNGDVQGLQGSATNLLAPARATGVAGYAPDGTGVYGSGGVIGVFAACVTAFAGGGSVGGVNTAYGVKVSATNPDNQASAIGVSAFVNGAAATAIHGSATNGTGIFGKADVSLGVYGKADVSLGVYGSAANYGIVGTAATNYGILATAAETYGIAGQANMNLAGYFVVKNAVEDYTNHVTGVYGSCSVSNLDGARIAYGGKFDAVNSATVAKAIGVEGAAAGVSATGVGAYANSGTGFYGFGSVIGAYLDGTATGVYGKAAANGTAIYGHAPNAGGTGVQGLGYTIGMYGSVVNAADTYGTNITAVYGAASAKHAGNGFYAIGGKFDASNIDQEASAVGVFGYGSGAGATGVYGSAPSGYGFGVYGTANWCGVLGYADAVSGQGVAGHGFGNTGTGVYGQATAGTGGYFAGGANKVGAYGIAGGTGSGVVGSGSVGIACIGSFSMNDTPIAPGGHAGGVPGNCDYWIHMVANGTAVYVPCSIP